MSLVIGDNFKYQGKKPNFERDSFTTKAEMKAFPETSIDEGHIAYCVEDKQHYVYSASNPVDGTTGKWKPQLGNIKGDVAELKSNITEYNVSKRHPKEGVGGTNKYTLEGAIAKIPAELRYEGIKCSFLNLSGDSQCYKWNGGSYFNEQSWKLNNDNGLTVEINNSSSDLNISDENGYIIAEFEGGHIKTKNFDSRKESIREDVSNADFNVADEDGNVLFELKGGHIKTKNFDSRKESIREDVSNADFNVADEDGNVLFELKGGHIKTKNFDSRNAQSSGNGINIKVLFIGNSVNQDHIAYLPWLLKHTYGDTINFTICNFYIGSFTINSYVNEVITGKRNADIWSVAENSKTWLNKSGTTLAAALKYTDYDIISMQGYFNNSNIEQGVKGPEDMKQFPVLVDFFKKHALKPFSLGFLMHQTYKSAEQGAFSRINEGAKIAIKDNPVEILFPCGYATTFAIKAGYPISELTPDNIHNTEGLPCILGSYVVATELSKYYKFPNKILKNTGRMTAAIQSQLNIPGANGVVKDDTTEHQYAICQQAALQAVKAGQGLYNSIVAEMYNTLKQ